MKELSAKTIEKPYRPEKIIQFGEGNFLRAFVDWIVQKMNEKTDFNGNIVIVQPIEKGMINELNSQDSIYHVNLQGIENGKQTDSLTRIDSVSRCINPYTEFESFLKLAEQEEIRFIISNTTESGIVYDNKCNFNDIPPASYPAKLTRLLFHRYTHFNGDKNKGLIIFPCELIFLNGHKLKEIIYKYIDLWQLGEDFKNWFTESCGVYATLVDRIVPGFPKKDIVNIQDRLGFKDNMVVQAEVFHLWVIEAPKKIAEEFPADKAGLNVIFVPSEEPYHQRKVTLLNGPHTVLAPVAFLSGIDIVRDACQDELIGKYIRQVMYKELLPTLDLPQSELKAFADRSEERRVGKEC